MPAGSGTALDQAIFLTIAAQKGEILGAEDLRRIASSLGSVRDTNVRLRIANFDPGPCPRRRRLSGRTRTSTPKTVVAAAQAGRARRALVRPDGPGSVGQPQRPVRGDPGRRRRPLRRHRRPDVQAARRHDGRAIRRLPRRTCRHPPRGWRRLRPSRDTSGSSPPGRARHPARSSARPSSRPSTRPARTWRSARRREGRHDPCRGSRPGAPLRPDARGLSRARRRARLPAAGAAAHRRRPGRARGQGHPAAVGRPVHRDDAGRGRSPTSATSSPTTCCSTRAGSPRPTPPPSSSPTCAARTSGRPSPCASGQTSPRPSTTDAARARCRCSRSWPGTSPAGRPTPWSSSSSSAGTRCSSTSGRRAPGPTSVRGADGPGRGRIRRHESHGGRPPDRPVRGLARGSTTSASSCGVSHGYPLEKSPARQCRRGRLALPLQPARQPRSAVLAAAP